MDVLFWGGLLAATLSAILAVFGLTHTFKTDDGSLTRSGKLALYGTATLGLLTVSLFAWQSETGRQDARTQAAKDRVALELLQFAALPPVNAFSAVIEYQADEYLAEMYAAFWAAVEGCGDPPFSRDFVDSNIVSRMEAEDGLVGVARIPEVCNGVQTDGAKPNWSILNPWVRYLGVPQFSISLYERNTDPDEAPLTSFNYQPWSADWQSLDAFYGFDYKTELSNVVIRRAPVSSEGYALATLQSLVGGYIILDLRPTLGDDPDGFPKGMAKSASEARGVNYFALHLSNGILIQLTEPSVIERNEGHVTLKYDFPKTTEALISALKPK